MPFGIKPLKDWTSEKKNGYMFQRNVKQMLLALKCQMQNEVEVNEENNFVEHLNSKR